MFDAMPPGQLATKIMPTASPGSKPSIFAVAQPASGMIVYWAMKPSATLPGMRPIALKSARLNVSPMPSIEAASDQKTQSELNHSITGGLKNAMTARLTSHTG